MRSSYWAGLVAAMILGAILLLRSNVSLVQHTPTVPRSVLKEAFVSKSNENSTHFQTGSQHNLKAFDWRQVESTDYRQYIANLRSIGCPEQTVRDIIIADVTQLFEERARSLRLKAGPYEFWRTDKQSKQRDNSQELSEALAEIDKERRAVIHELLGVELESRLDHLSFANELDPRLDFLSIQRQMELRKIEGRFTAMRSRVLDGQFGTEDEMEVLKRLQDERDKQISTVLSSEEREEYDLRVSPSAEKLRDRLTDINVTAEEFRELFSHQQQFDSNHPAFDLSLLFNTDAVQARNQAEANLNSHFRRVLGEKRNSALKSLSNP